MPTVERLAGDAVWISEKGGDVASGSRILAMGPTWMLECIQVESGAVSFVRDGEWVTQSGGCFGLFLPAFGVIEARYADVRWSWVGFSAPGPPPARWLNAPMMFDIAGSEFPDRPEALLRTIVTPRHHQRLERISRPSAISRRAKTALDTTYRDGHSIAALAERLGVSHAHLTRGFTRDYGLSPVRYRQQIRIRDANERLFHGEAIARVAFDVGYNDLSRFYRGFRDVCNVSPAKIKKRQDATR